MKRFLLLMLSLIISLIICCVVLFVLYSSWDKITVKGKDGTKYESYQECCAAQDFQAAHLFLAKMEQAGKGNWYITDAKKFVFKQEALYLMSIGDEASKKRIIYLLKEEENEYDVWNKYKFIEHVDMLIDLAIENDDDQLVMSLLDIKKSREIDKKIVKYLAGFKDEAHVNYIVNMLAIIESPYTPLQPGKYKEDEVILSTNRYYKEYFKNEYAQWAQAYNMDCKTVLETAITYGNELLAKKILILYKQNVKLTEVKNTSYYLLSYDNSDKEAAQKKYDEAVKSGAFK